MCKNIDLVYEPYYFAIYDYFDNFITTLENIEDLSKFFNKPLFKIRESIKKNACICLDNNLYKVFILKKEKDLDLVRSR